MFCKKEVISVETLSLLIADCSDDFRNSLESALQGNYRVHTCRSGREALELLKTITPDILVMDLMLPELDGISLLQALNNSGIRPTVLATTRLVNDYVVSTTTRLGVDYLMVKPCSVQAIVNRVRDLSKQKPRPVLSAPDSRTHISNLLVSLGIPTKLRGYAYLREAVLLMSENPMQSITKELYPSVARQFNCTPSQVERSIRNAIQQSWEKRSDEVWTTVFQPDGSGTIPRPSNAAFISRLADRLLLDQVQLTTP